MMSLLPVLVFVCLTSLADATLLDTLKAVHTSPVFKNLTHTEQVLVIELVAEAEAGELKAYIDTIGFQTVLQLLDSLPETEAHLLTHLFAEELNKETNQGSVTNSPLNPVGRRDLAALLKQMEANSAFQHLSTEDRQLVTEIVKAVSSNTLEQMIQNVGYARILSLLDALPEADSHRLSMAMEQHLPHGHPLN